MCDKKQTNGNPKLSWPSWMGNKLMKPAEIRITIKILYEGLAPCSALWFNRGTSPKPEIQCFSGLYLRFCLIEDKMNKYIF